MYIKWYVKLKYLPLSQNFPVHPSSHPPSHWPVTWLQGVRSLQCPTHCWLQLIPYHPFLHSVHTEGWLLSKAVKHYCNDTELKLHLKFGLCWFTIRNLTCSTIHSSPSRFTREARSVLYETRAVITVCGTRCVTVSAVDTSIIASCIKLKINYTRYLQKICIYHNRHVTITLWSGY